ncbi:MAG TPA: aminotransferase class V-fold PLP-dependent enzyme [Methyloceanibacter sp.]|jgi:selenocysteine lyase/cysteine desulfurase|nr:aminotransferase class V-fold PLP-dependent enzyme [Methyloceanibacter sp.]
MVQTRKTYPAASTSLRREDLPILGRRAFIQGATIASALFGVPLARAEQALAQEPSPLPPRDLYTTAPEAYWAELRRQWLLVADRINLNCGALGCTPLPVLHAMIDHLIYAESYREPDNPWFGYAENSHIRSTREALANFLNCKIDELALTRNVTEGNNTICHGLDLMSGDEVLLTDQEHPGGRCPWEQKAARFGVKLNFVKLPLPPVSDDEIVKLFENALTSRTRIIVFSHITWETGLLLPAKEICALARRHGILTHIDGAHALGHIPLDLRDLGCDFYATNAHKWLMAPKGSGLLFIREEHLERLWANTVGQEWRNYKLKAYRFSNLGTSNLSVIVGVKAALDFVNAIVPERIYSRIHELGRKVRDRLREHNQIRLLNASLGAFHTGLVSFEAVGGDLTRVFEECEARRIRIRYWGDAGRIRVSTHIFTQQTELDAFFDAVERGLRG